jgi:hypothetical protein
MIKKCVFGFVFLVMLFHLSVCHAESNYEINIFGINMKTFKNSNWIEVAAGALSSVLVHEMGHALYLTSQDKDWELSAAFSGLAIETDAHLSNAQYRNFGRAGFALQSLVGAFLTFFDSTRNSDFTKGWVSMNTFQISTYSLRSHHAGSDFELIEKGNGNKELEFSAFAFISEYNKINAFRPDTLPIGITPKTTEGIQSWSFSNNDSDMLQDQRDLFSLTMPKIDPKQMYSSNNNDQTPDLSRFEPRESFPESLSNLQLVALDPGTIKLSSLYNTKM